MKSQPTIIPKTRRAHVKRERLPPLTNEQQQVLQAYAAKHGRRWKSVLSNAWMGGPPYDDGGILRSLRNSHGPTWLVSYRLPRPVAEITSDGMADLKRPKT